MVINNNDLSQKEDKSISRWYGANLALLLGEKIEAFYLQFYIGFIKTVIWAIR